MGVDEASRCCFSEREVNHTSRPNLHLFLPTKLLAEELTAHRNSVLLRSSLQTDRLGAVRLAGAAEFCLSSVLGGLAW
jgi:hypothetical protein